MALLETKSLTKSFGALTAVNGVSLAVEAGSLHSIIGPQRRGQDHAIQPAHRHLPTDIGADPFRPEGHHGNAGEPRRAPWPGALLPAHHRLSRLQRFLSGLPLLQPGNPGRVCCIRKQVAMPKWPGGQAGPQDVGTRTEINPAGARALARRAAPARAGDRACRGAARAAAGRAGRRPLARGDAPHGGAGAYAQGRYTMV